MKSFVVNTFEPCIEKVFHCFAVSLIAVVAACNVHAQSTEDFEKIVKDAKKTRKAVMSEAKEFQNEAALLMERDKYFEASQKCMIAQKKLESLKGPLAELKLRKLNAFIAALRVEWAAKLQRDARLAFLHKKYEDAIALSRSASKINPDQEEQSKAFMKKCEKMAKAAVYNSETKLSVIDPEDEIKKDDIGILMKEAEIMYKNKQYDKASQGIERILLRDPYNEKAAYLLEKIYRQLYRVGTKRRFNEVLERDSEIDWGWSQGILPTENITPPVVGPAVREASKSGIYEKLQNIIFDNIEFDDASITSVVTHLSERSKQLDPEGKGVNLILQLSPKIRTAPPRVTMSFDQIPMDEVIRYLCQGAGLKYRIESRAVLIGDRDIDNMETQRFPVRAELIASLSQPKGDDDADGEGGESMVDSEDIFDAENTFDATAGEGRAAGGKTASSLILMQYFIDRGIPFDSGATIAYDRRSGRLIVKNTPDSLRKLEHLLRELDITKPMVLIESKILEITQTDMDELGFDWVFNMWSQYHPQSVIQSNDKILRSYASPTVINSTSSGAHKLINELNILPNFGDVNQYNLSLTVNAISQCGKAEVLSSPRVIASSGTTATIRMVKEMYFPESWNDPEVSMGDNGSFSYTPSYPEFGDPTDIGIRFEVTPTVFSNNYTILLELNPQVVSHTGWTDYGYNILVGDITMEQGTSNLKMPEISRRDLVTKVKVFDGETVVLGGMLKDQSYSRNDKWPGLGDVPLIGRLFSSQFERTVKTNLLMFVTARLMNNDGVPVRQNIQRGLPEFNR